MDKQSCQIHKLVADVCVIAESHVLLVRYKDTSKYDQQEGWFLPDDFLEHLEHPDEAARRILREQAAIDGSALRLSHMESFGDGTWHLIFHYHAQLGAKAGVAASGNIAEARWFPLDALPEPSSVAHHGWALDNIEQIVAAQT